MKYLIFGKTGLFEKSNNMIFQATKEEMIEVAQYKYDKAKQNIDRLGDDISEDIGQEVLKKYEEKLKVLGELNSDLVVVRAADNKSTDSIRNISHSRKLFIWNKKILVVGIISILYLFAFYGTRSIKYDGHVYTFKEYHSLMNFQGNSNKIQLMKKRFFRDKEYQIFGVNLYEKFYGQLIIYRFTKLLSFIAWAGLVLALFAFLERIYINIVKKQ